MEKLAVLHPSPPQLQHNNCHLVLQHSKSKPKGPPDSSGVNLGLGRRVVQYSAKPSLTSISCTARQRERRCRLFEQANSTHPHWKQQAYCSNSRP